MSKMLESANLTAGLAELDGWQVNSASSGDSGPQLQKTYSFRGFNAAFGFMTRVAMQAERANHHPDFQTAYSRVTVIWTTHSSGGITALDLELARLTDLCASDTALKA